MLAFIRIFNWYSRRRVDELFTLLAVGVVQRVWAQQDW